MKGLGNLSSWNKTLECCHVLDSLRQVAMEFLFSTESLWNGYVRFRKEKTCFTLIYLVMSLQGFLLFPLRKYVYLNFLHPTGQMKIKNKAYRIAYVAEAENLRHYYLKSYKR